MNALELYLDVPELEHVTRRVLESAQEVALGYGDELELMELGNQALDHAEQVCSDPDTRAHYVTEILNVAGLA